MPLLAGTGQQAYIAFLCFLTGFATAPLYEWTRPFKRKNKATEFSLDLFYMLAAGGVFLLFTHTALKGILSFYTAVSFFGGAAAGVFTLRKTQKLLLRFFRPVRKFLNEHIVSALPKHTEQKNDNGGTTGENANKARDTVKEPRVKTQRSLRFMRRVPIKK